MSASTLRLTEVAVEAAEKAVAVFREQGWMWAGDDDPPSVACIAASLAESLSRMRDCPDTLYSRSGRFRISRDVNWDSGHKLGPDELCVSLELGVVALVDTDPQRELDGAAA